MPRPYLQSRPSRRRSLASRPSPSCDAAAAPSVRLPLTHPPDDSLLLLAQATVAPPSPSSRRTPLSALTPAPVAPSTPPRAAASAHLSLRSPGQRDEEVTGPQAQCALPPWPPVPVTPPIRSWQGRPPHWRALKGSPPVSGDSYWLQASALRPWRGSPSSTSPVRRDLAKHPVELGCKDPNHQGRRCGHNCPPTPIA
ncbi:hypothetical protein PVAP13_1KG119000 [Panicum virgatum]|uniref:Uncharacterized protein n=1 Tax=Panicum virgatum TaxID=38727 RepID=A0A8T0XGG2_PANVG|nr:hypothetical protein PVAP13_1KG119000 [Panicum virgatum]